MNREMKDSGILAIGAIPKEWKPIRIKYLLQNGVIKSGPYGSALKEVASADGEYTIYNQANIINDDFSLRRNYISSKDYINMKRYKIHSGDIVFSMMGTVGKCSIVPEWIDEGIIDSHLFEATLNSLINKDYFKYSYDKDLCVQVIEQFIEAMNGSIMSGLNGGLVKNSFICLPSPTEQQQIVHFLDRKCTAIDTAIEKTKKSIEKLEEYKKAVITKAVTKGIDPNAKMKDSGVEWIGEIPEDWDVKQLRTYFSRRINKNIHLQEKNLLSLSYGRIVRKNIDTKEGLLPESFDGYNIVEDGDIVIRGTDLQNDHRSLRTGLVTERGIITSAYMTLRSKENVNSTYYHYLLHCYDISKVFYSMGGGLRQSLDYWEFIRMPVLHPTDREQEEIISYIKTKCAAIDAAIEKKKKAIEKLEEYKKSLIYYAVTGKIDCRNEVI